MTTITMRKLMVQNGKTLIPRSYKFPSPKERQNAAHGANREWKAEDGTSPEGTKDPYSELWNVFPGRIHRGVEHQSSKLVTSVNFLLHKATFICYKQFTESICVAGWALFCNSRARPASNDLEGLNPSIAPATGLDSETPVGF